MSAQQQIAEFRKTMTVVPCTKTSVPQLIGFYGASNGGKTVTALICLVGMVGPKAKLGIVDTENRRAGIAKDIVQKMAQEHYGAAPEIVCVNLDPPFHPLRYVAALQELREKDCAAFLVDSMSHAWQGEGGYLDLKEAELDRMAGQDWKRREQCAMAAAAHVKPATHSVLVRSILQLKVPTVLCFRSKEKAHLSKEGGKTKIEVDPYGTPIQEAGMIYEMLISGEVSARDGIGGYCSWRGEGRKTTHPAILALLPPEGQQFGFGHGRALADWCGEPGARPAAAVPVPPSAQAPPPVPTSQPALPLSSQPPPAQSPPAPAPAPGTALPDAEAKKALIAKLWQLTTPYRPAGETSWTSTREFLLSKGFVPEPGVLRNLTFDELETAILKVRSYIANPPRQ
jgi:hypothetical protein